MIEIADCIFCKIVNGEIPCDVVYQDENVLAFKDINPVAPIHVIIIPKKHIESVLELNDDNIGVVSSIFKAAKSIATELSLDKTGFRVVTNIGKDGGQTVSHLHYHLLGGRSLGWPPG